MTRAVLVVDDDQFIRKLVATTLEDVSEFDLHEAADGVEALEVAQETQPAIVFLDVDMPRMDGIDTCRQMRPNPSTSEATIVMLTAAHGDQIEQLAEEAGADLFLTKPFSPLDLLRLVDGLGEQTADLVQPMRIRTIVLTTNAIAKPIVQRFRLRSTSEPPPSGPAPVPDAERAGQPGVLARVHEDQEDQPHAEDHLDEIEDRGHARDGSEPQSGPCSGLTSSSARMISIASARSVPVDRSVVLVRQLAGAQVEFGVADLAVLGVAGRLELGDPSRPPAQGRGADRAAPAAAPRSRYTATASTTSTITYVHAIGSDQLAGADLRRAGDRAAARRRRGYRRTAAPRGGGSGHSAISPPIAARIAPSHSQVTSGETISRKVAVQGWVTNRWVSSRMARSRSWKSRFSALARAAGGWAIAAFSALLQHARHPG